MPKDTFRGLMSEFGLRLVGVVGQSIGEAVREAAVRGRADAEREAVDRDEAVRESIREADTNEHRRLLAAMRRIYKILGDDDVPVSWDHAADKVQELVLQVGMMEQKLRAHDDLSVERVVGGHEGKAQARVLSDKLDAVMRSLMAQNRYDSTEEQVEIADVIARLRSGLIVPLGAPGAVEGAAKALDALAESTGSDNVEETMGFVRDIAKELRAAAKLFRVTSMSSDDLKHLAGYMGEHYAALVADKVSSRDIAHSNWAVDLATELLDRYRETPSLELQLREFVAHMANEHPESPHLLSARDALGDGVPLLQTIMGLMAHMVRDLEGAVDALAVKTHQCAEIEKEVAKVRAGLAESAEDEERVETGPLQIGDDDWPGLFIRGDNAMHFGLNLQLLLDTWEPGESDKILHEVLSGLRRLLGSCIVPVEPGRLQKYKRYAVKGGWLGSPLSSEELQDAPIPPEVATRAPRAEEGES